MKDEPIDEIILDLGSALARVGDRERVRGSARLTVGEGFDVEFFPGDEIVWSLEARRITGGVEITGDLTGAVTLQCYRCLESFEYPLRLRLKEHTLWLTSDELEPGDDYGDEYAVMDGVLDLLPILRDVTCLSLPVRRICSQDCRGLCVSCGTNLNVKECGCNRKKVDSRLKPLMDLKKRLEEKE